MMDAGMDFIGFLRYAIALWLATGLIILRIEVKGYELAGMSKERKVCRFLGWMNVCFGLLLFAGRMMF